MRIRNFALIVTGAFLGLGGYAIKDGGVVKLLGLEVSIAGLVVVSAIYPFAAFYFMDRLLFDRGCPPAKIRVDNGPEFISRALDHWAYINRVTLDFSRPGKPTDNAFVESFNGVAGRMPEHTLVLVIGRRQDQNRGVADGLQ